MHGGGCDAASSGADGLSADGASADGAPAVTGVVLSYSGIAWAEGRCGSCGEAHLATVEVGGTRLCATCLHAQVQRQLNYERRASDGAAVVPGPATWLRRVEGLDSRRCLELPQALLSCESCVPDPRTFVSRLGGMWLCDDCVEEFLQRMPLQVLMQVLADRVPSSRPAGAAVVRVAR